MKTLEDEQYVVIKAYKFTVFEIWRDFNVLSYIACPRYPYIRVYRLYDYTFNDEVNCAIAGPMGITTLLLITDSL